MTEENAVLGELRTKFGTSGMTAQSTRDRVPTIWVDRDRIIPLLGYLKTESPQPYCMLYDLTAIDERVRRRREDQPPSDFTLVYHLLSFERNEDIRIKTALQEEALWAPTATNLWRNANWYEREVWDMFGVTFEGHPNLRRILLPSTWKGHPLRKEHPARATEMGPFTLPEEEQDREQEALKFRPEEWGIQPKEGTELMFLNLGPQHPGTHGPFRVIVGLEGETIAHCVPEIGFHHRGAEKIGERQSWHTYIPYTDRVDYLGGVNNNLPYVLAVEQLAGIQVPDRVQVIRVMLCELFRIISHLVWYGTFAQDLGALSPVFYTFSDREHAFDVVSAICGNRMHPNWFRIGGVAQDLPQGWDRVLGEFVRRMEKHLVEYDRMVMKNRILQGRTRGVGVITRDEAIEWGVTGPMLRACGCAWDFRKKRPYSGYQEFEFEVPTAEHGDCYDRALVRVEEMRQSLRIIQQCVDHMPSGPYKALHPLTTPPPRPQTLHDIETLISHFLGVSWGPLIPAGEGFVSTEATKGNNGYYLISDGSPIPYRVRIRTPSFAHLQLLPLMSEGHTLGDLLAILGSIDFVLGDVDR